MKRSIHFKLQSLFLACTLSLFQIALAQGFAPEVEAKLQSVLNTFQAANNNIGGMSAAIKVDGLAMWQGATGFASQDVAPPFYPLQSGTPFTTSTLSRMYSVTKTFTAALVLELAREKVFNLDDPISKFLDIAALNPALNPNVTIRQLLAHESGYSDYIREEVVQGMVLINPTRTFTPYDIIPYVRQLFTSGSTRLYSSTNYVLLGAIIEKATNKPVEQLLRQRFFTPLGLNSIYLDGRETQLASTILASPHENMQLLIPGFPVPLQTNIGGLLPFNGIMSLAFTAGALVGNVGDMAEWGNALFGGRATSKQTVDLLLNSISPTPDPDDDRLGYGIFTNTKVSNTDSFVGHNGNAIGYRSLMFYQPNRKMTIAILSNNSATNVYAVAKALYEALPQFVCGNKKEDKILLCSDGREKCVARPAAANFIKKGSFLGSCSTSGITKEAKQFAEPSNIMAPLLVADVLNYTIFPNPAKDKVQLSFRVKETGQVSITVYDIHGRLISTAFNGLLEKGSSKQVLVDAMKLSPGIYFARLQTARGVSQQKFVINR